MAFFETLVRVSFTVFSPFHSPAPVR